jgi:predicted AlkP superfamily phosphohydrolase/phosphomutase
VAGGRLAERVLLVGWDGADWKMINRLVEAGQMPNMKRFTEEGVMGNVASLQPMLSPILWTSIATGKHADKHGILGFAELDGATGKIRPVTSTSRKCKAIWNILSDHGLKAGVVNWYASHPAEKINGYVVTDRFPQATAPPDKEWPKIPGSVHPDEYLEELCALRVHPGRTTATQIAPFIPKLAELDPTKDEPLQHLRALLAHCATVHAAATWLVEEFEWDFLGVYYDAIDRFAHQFMEYHPPKMEHVSDEDFQRYRDVMTMCYQFHDMMLGRLMNLAGDDTTVVIVSDHGFHCDELRPQGTSAIKGGQPVAWHRPYGVVAAWGPRIKKDERIYGASLLDVAPTVLTMLGLPVAEDMDGQPLTQIFEQGPFEVPTIETYEEPSDQKQAETAEDDPRVAEQVLKQLKQLGYIDTDDADGVIVDRLRNLGQVYVSTGRPQEAMEQFRQGLERRPDDKGAKIMIASCLMSLGRLDDAAVPGHDLHAPGRDG